MSTRPRKTLPPAARAACLRLGGVKPLGCLLLAALLGACQAPRPGGLQACEQPGWGRPPLTSSQRLDVRVVPAAAAPEVPVTPFGTPGWGALPR